MDISIDSRCRQIAWTNLTRKLDNAFKTHVSRLENQQLKIMNCKNCGAAIDLDGKANGFNRCPECFVSIDKNELAVEHGSTSKDSRLRWTAALEAVSSDRATYVVGLLCVSLFLFAGLIYVEARREESPQVFLGWLGMFPWQAYIAGKLAACVWMIRSVKSPSFQGFDQHSSGDLSGSLGAVLTGLFDMAVFWGMGILGITSEFGTSGLLTFVVILAMMCIIGGYSGMAYASQNRSRFEVQDKR